MALSQNTLQELANSMGIQQRVATMSEAEKAQLRYIQIIKSTTEWQGDMARTLISPANAIRVLKQQFTLLGRALGRVVIPFIMKTIPYVMALTQVLTDLANRLASFFGYKITDIDYSSLKDISFEIEDIGKEAEETTNKLNTMLAPFDELNVVQNQKNNETSPLASIFGDEYDLPEYDALAGLTKEMEKQVESAKKNLENILTTVGLIGVGFLGWKVSKNIFDFIDAWNDVKGSLQKKIGLTLALTGIALTAKGQLDIKENFWKGLAEKLGGTIATGVGTFMFTKNLGISLLVTAISLATQSYFDADNFWLAIGERLGASVGLGFGTFMLTKSLVLSFAVSLGYFLFAPKGSETLIPQWLKDAKKEAEEYNKMLLSNREQIEKNLEENLALEDHHKKLYDELLNITDQNGKVKDGYEARAKFILDELSNAYGIEYEYLDGQISKFDDLKKSVEEIIAKKRIELTMEAFRDKYIDALKHEKETNDKLKEAEKQRLQIRDQQLKVEDELAKKKEKLRELQFLYNNSLFFEREEIAKLKGEISGLEGSQKDLNEQYKIAVENSNLYKETVAKNTSDIKNYEDLMTADLSGSLDDINEKIDSFLGRTKDDFIDTFGEIPDDVSNAIKDLPNTLENDLKNPFKKAAKTLGQIFGVNLSDNIIIDSNTLMSTLSSAINSLPLPSSMKTALKNLIPKTNIKLRAEGGFPKTGEFFIAREAGPELVGKIGNQTAVANNDQITTSITNALVTALSGMNLGGGQNKTIVNIGGRKVYEGVGDYVDSENDRYGTNYIQV